MKVQKAGCILINLETKAVGLVYRTKKDDYSFPKGHLEDNETLEECAIRETEEETGRRCSIVSDIVIKPIEYVTPLGEDVINYHYVAIDLGESEKEIADELKEKLVWIKYDVVEETLSYKDLKEIWNSVKEEVKKLFNE